MQYKYTPPADSVNVFACIMHCYYVHSLQELCGVGILQYIVGRKTGTNVRCHRRG